MRQYRNTRALTSIEGILVDKGALWSDQNGTMVLVDDDQHVTHPRNEHFEQT